MHTITTLDNGNAVYTFINDDFIHIRRSDGELDFSKSSENLDEVGRRLGNKQCRVLINNTGFDIFGKQVREVLDKQLIKISSSVAFVGENYDDLGMAKLFISLSNLNVPMKAFNSEKDALAWLNELVKSDSEKVALELFSTI